MRTAGTAIGRGGGDSGGIFKGGRRGGETQCVVPRPPLNAFRGVGEPLCEQRSLTAPAKNEARNPFPRISLFWSESIQLYAIKLTLILPSKRNLAKTIREVIYTASAKTPAPHGSTRFPHRRDCKWLKKPYAAPRPSNDARLPTD